MRCREILVLQIYPEFIPLKSGFKPKTLFHTIECFLSEFGTFVFTLLKLIGGSLMLSNIYKKTVNPCKFNKGMVYFTDFLKLIKAS